MCVTVSLFFSVPRFNHEHAQHYGGTLRKLEVATKPQEVVMAVGPSGDPTSFAETSASRLEVI